MTRRRVLTVAAITFALLAGLMSVATAYEGSSLYDNIGPRPPSQSKGKDYPSNRYGLDYHVDDGFSSTGIPAPGIGPLPPGLFDIPVPTKIKPGDAFDRIPHKLASWGWDIERFFSGIVVTVHAFSQSLDIIDGALTPAAGVVNNLYAAIGGGWFGLALSCLGLWIALQMAGRNFTHTIGGVLKSLACAMLAMLIIAQPIWTIGGTLHLFNEAGNAASAEITGTRDPTSALRRALIEEPFLALEFGGTQHCVDAADKPVPPWSKDCVPSKKIDNRKRYMDRWLKAGPPNGKERTLWHTAMLNGKNPSGKEINDAGMPANSFDGIKLGPEDKSAVDIQQAQGGGDRLVGVFILFWGLLPAWLLIGGLSLLKIVAVFAVIAWFIATPIALLAAVVPGAGTEAFMMWARGLLGNLARPLWYGLLIAIALAVTIALFSSMASLGFLMTFVAFAGVMWFFLLKWKRIYMGVAGAITRGGSSGQQHRSAGQRLTNAHRQQRAARALTGAVVGGPAGAVAATGRHMGLGARTGRDMVKARNEKRLGADTAAKTVAAGGLWGRAVSELEGEHGKVVATHAKETKNRARMAELEGRQRKAAKPDLATLATPLTDKERQAAERQGQRDSAELATLKKGRMPAKEYDALSATVNDVDERKRKTGAGFGDEQVAARARVIAARDAAEQANGNGSGGKQRLAALRDRVRRHRTLEDTLGPIRTDIPDLTHPTPPDGLYRGDQAPPTPARRDWSAHTWDGNDWKTDGDPPPQEPPPRVQNGRARKPPESGTKP